MDPPAWYVEQSSITDPGEYVDLFDNLPADVAGICHVLQGLGVGYLGGERFLGYAVPEERRPEVDTCYIKEMLAWAPAELQPVEFDGGDAARGVRREQKTKGR